MSAAAGGRPRGKDAGKHFPTSPPTFLDRQSPWLLRLRLGARAGLFLWPAPCPTCPCAEWHEGHREHRLLWSTGELPALPIRIRTNKISTVLGIYTTGPGGVFVVSHVVACTCLEHVYRIAKSAFLPIGMSIGDPNRHFWRQSGIGIGFSAQNADEKADRHLHRLSEDPINGRRQPSRTLVLTDFSYLGRLKVLDHRSSSLFLHARPVCTCHRQCWHSVP